MKIIAIDYKGKYFTLQDNDIPLDFMDYPLPYIDVEHIIGSDDALREHVESCIYYGIPPYHGDDEKLKERINSMYPVCTHDCTSNCRRNGCNCECGEYHLLPE